MSKFDRLPTSSLEAVAIAEEVVEHSLRDITKARSRRWAEAIQPWDGPSVEMLEEAARIRKGYAVCANQISPWKKDDALSQI